MAEHHDNHGHDAEHGHGHGGGHDEVRVEESTLPNASILAFVGITVLVFFTSAFTLPTVFYRILDYMNGTMNQESPGGSPELVALRAHEVEQLTTYGYVDKDKQIVHIPIDIAMQKVVEDAKK